MGIVTDDLNANDPHVQRARCLLNKWIEQINTEGALSNKRSYVRELILRHLESKIAAECLVDLLAEEFARDAYRAERNTS